MVKNASVMPSFLDLPISNPKFEISETQLERVSVLNLKI